MIPETKSPLAVFAAVMLMVSAAFCADTPAERWFARFAFAPPPVESAGLCEGNVGQLPSFSVIPSRPGLQLVRVSLPFAKAALPLGLTVAVYDGDTRLEVAPDLRVLTLHPGKPQSVRRAIVTFPFPFEDLSRRTFRLKLADASNVRGTEATGEPNSIEIDGLTIAMDPNAVLLRYPSGESWSLRSIAPDAAEASNTRFEFIERGSHFVWVRLLVWDATWPRIIDLRADSLGTVIAQLHLQRLEEGDATAPDLGWTLEGPAVAGPLSHNFAREGPIAIRSADGNCELRFPSAHLLRRGGVSVADDAPPRVTYLRCREDEGVPFQSSAWRSATVVVSKSHSAPLNECLEPDHQVSIESADWKPLYEIGPQYDLAMWPALEDLEHDTRRAIRKSALTGDDFGNVTSYEPDAAPPLYGMNRLNHCPPIFREYYRSGDVGLRKVALNWCANFYDLSIWWGDTPDFGGTRYNNAAAAGRNEHQGDTNFMWRTNGTATFCTKGFDSFFYAYEETGDPRMLAALRAQIEYARRFVHADQGECRNIGIASDFLALYRHTGVSDYRDEALRLFRELRTKLSAGHLFSQGGQPIIEDGPFIDDDAHGYEAPFAKPYIIGYALYGLPELLGEFPDEPELREVVRAVADFLAETVDPAGGWRYPHPSSSSVIISQGVEHAYQLALAAEPLEAHGEDVSNLVGAIETVLRARVGGYLKTGQFLGALTGWERSTGAIPEGKTIYDLYTRPDQRDRSRDYTAGGVAVGGAPPDGLVHFFETLRFYLRRRPADRLFDANPELALVLARVPDRRLRLTPAERGSFVRVSHPDQPEIGFTVWAPEWLTFPNLGYSDAEFGGMSLEWKRDERTGAVWYTIQRPEADFTAHFTPRTDYVECAYTTWPNPDSSPPSAFALGPCQQMKPGVFEGDEASMLERTWFLADGKWVSLASCANGNPRNVQYVKGQPSPDMTGAMAESGWRTIQSPRPDVPLIACVSTDGAWVGATAAEFSTSICNNAGPSHRCLHAQGSMPLNPHGPTTLRVNAYLMRGGLDDLREKYERDVSRWNRAPAAASPGVARTAGFGVRGLLPVFAAARLREMDFPLAWPKAGLSFDDWRASARKAYLESLGPRPALAPFAVQVVDREDREAYTAEKLAINISATERVKAYLLRPDGAGPYPAIIALHDHGAHFSIGKEKVVRPFGESPERLNDSREWVEKYYGGRYVGDELARRGYVVFAVDALYWGDRGRFEGVSYEEQQALGANMLQLGLSWSGKIVWDDIRSAEFIRSLPEVNPERIGCIGLSMGAHRTWSLCAATDVVKAGAAICWMGDTPALMAPGNNQTRGQSAFSMLVPGLRNLLDYPDVASIACPKPMLFFNGTEDALFPIPGVESAYARMRRVWSDQGAADRLVTELWPVPHEFNREMQEKTFDWLDRQLRS